MIGPEQIRPAAELAAQHRIAARRQSITRWGIEKPIRDMFYCLEHEPKDLDFALAAAKGMLETSSHMRPGKRLRVGYQVIDLLWAAVVVPNPMMALQKQKEILSAYVLLYRAELGREQAEAKEGDRFEFRCNPDLKAWIEQQGGSDYVRGLIEADQARQAE